MATAEQIARGAQSAVVAILDEKIADLDKRLRKYEPLIEQKKKLEAARRALLSERAPTAGGGRGLTQEEVVNALGDEMLTVHQIATKLSASPGAVRAHLNRGVDERFTKEEDGRWSVRDPERDEEEDDDDED